MFLFLAFCRRTRTAVAEAAAEAEEARVTRCKNKRVSQTSTADTSPSPPSLQKEHALLADVLHLRQFAARPTDACSAHSDLGVLGDSTVQVRLLRLAFGPC